VREVVDSDRLLDLRAAVQLPVTVLFLLEAMDKP
jgi:hypothetical protein